MLWLPCCSVCERPLDDGIRFVGRAPPVPIFEGRAEVACRHCGSASRLGPDTEWVPAAPIRGQP